jgi:predicted RNA-binding protein YlxR (DUF448 family)
MRVVRTPDGDIALDPGGHASGRGAYVCRAAECVDIAIRKGALGRALRSPLPGDLRETLAAGIADHPITTIEGGARGQE